MNRSLLLFDIDGTLISSQEFLQVYSRQLDRGLTEFFGKHVPVDFAGLHGNTERYNIRAFLQRSEIEYSEETLDNFFRGFGETYHADARHLKVLPDVAETLPILEKNNLLRIVTGNQEFVARKRLQAVGLNDYLKFGGFGDERYDRKHLVFLARGRALRYSWNDGSSTYITGDTVRDVEAGKEAGVRTIAVCTGSSTREQLEKSNPDYVIDRFSELQRIFNC